MNKQVSSSKGNNKPYDFLVFIGRFQPFHNGHLAVINEGLKQAEQMIVLCGSAHQPRSARNPWTVAEREAMIRGAVGPEASARIHVAPLMDIVYNDESWVRNVQATINGLVTAHHGVPHKLPKVGLIGHSKDQSSYYLNLFPQWGAVAVENYQSLSATPIREAVFSAEGEAYVEGEKAKQVLPASVQQEMVKFSRSEVYKEVKGEYEFVAKYKEAWSAAPYAPTFVTVDAVVIQSGHVLMVERKARPGKGLMALPGGFVDHGEKLVDACLRELREETRLKVPAPVMRGSIKKQEVFDDPHRSARGRTITHAFYIELEPNKALPKVKGGDDAKHAMWVPLAELDPANIFEDHYFIIQEMIGM
ncbi:bifunctional nicotinamide-nucleotide adenylyltransferase/Nudix hydroxylase [Dasania sp. GY-MA-18]|uniref:Bifunctional nicotinamide-nucleotide adenylyltransferase/Nudix hydroxylase n=1 Tax=Dasania phycosphaerae TaxID=2950436 RepID=A0A9J6RKL6_9GAMM|nr:MULTISPECIES: bifunctional nicotinamide-nucleotide adenylyltransferase/Nudix hydroxylase [Dasania]MCR8922340.1 bifunctional nicotinamide-nucleotide adenylyltransferase/Nudix hydroxylase [Dasania sp. GY-MA-18]MCZ0864768.1 bifunctional nicotinamide-nucleotide adenylyltransferase/Nudix hydroxylase [Dasania phycosphaerae]MCZ0868496.1 bifunctional nicotinamide-nucleotide adenylyltransferase/Nudix hydroxylase [Dasania phycosphaerae]